VIRQQLKAQSDRTSTVLANEISGTTSVVRVIPQYGMERQGETCPSRSERLGGRGTLALAGLNTAEKLR